MNNISFYVDNELFLVLPENQKNNIYGFNVRILIYHLVGHVSDLYV